MNKIRISLHLLSDYRAELMGLSAIGIIMCHARGNNVSMPPMLDAVCSLGQIGVPIFFLLSGLGMYYSLVRRDTEGSRIIDWYTKRCIRILVPYILMALPFYVWYCIHTDKGIVWFIAAISTLSFWFEGSGVWFVAAIVALYLIVPFWHRFMKSIKHDWIPTVLVFFGLICCGQWRHLSEIAFFFLGYGMGKYVKGEKSINLIFWIVIPSLLYVIAKVAPALDCLPRLLFLVIPFLLIAVLFFEKIGNSSKIPFKFMGKISLESYMANVMLPTVLMTFPWVINGIDLNKGNRLLYFCVIVFGVLLAYGVHKFSQPIIKRFSSTLEQRWGDGS